MKRSMLRRMSSTIPTEFEIENLKIEEPDFLEGKTGDQFKYTIHHCSLGIDGSDQLDFYVDGPQNSDVIVEEHPRLINTVTVSLVPLKPGNYRLKILHRNEVFYISKELYVEGEEIDAEEIIKKVKIIGPHASFGYTQTINEFTLDASQCPRFGGLITCVKSLSPRTAAKLYLTDHQNGIYTIGYKPTLAGEFLLTIKMCGLDVPGSPLHIRVPN